eukprot:g2966.t1
MGPCASCSSALLTKDQKPKDIAEEVHNIVNHQSTSKSPNKITNSQSDKIKKLADASYGVAFVATPHTHVRHEREIRDKYQWQQKNMLGKGMTGGVFTATCRTSGGRYALKTIDKTTVKKIDDLREEIVILKQLDHPNIVRLRESFEDRLTIYLVLELCEAYSALLVNQMLNAIRFCHEHGVVHRDLKLENWLFETKERKRIKLIDFGLSRRYYKSLVYSTDKMRRPRILPPGGINSHMTSAIAKADQAQDDTTSTQQSMSTQQSSSPQPSKTSTTTPAIHTTQKRDANANNVNGDSSKSKNMKKRINEVPETRIRRMFTKVGTPYYVAPEVLREGGTGKNKKGYSESCDIWGIGVITFMLLSGTPPFGGRTDEEIFANLKQNRWRFRPRRIWNHISSDAQNFVKFLLNPNVETRPTAGEALRHTWLSTNREIARKNNGKQSSRLSRRRKSSSGSVVNVNLSPSQRAMTSPVKPHDSQASLGVPDLTALDLTTPPPNSDSVESTSKDASSTSATTTTTESGSDEMVDAVSQSTQGETPSSLPLEYRSDDEIDEGGQYLGETLSNFVNFPKVKQMGLVLMAKYLGRSELLELREMFEEIDTNCTGYITLQELKNCLLQTDLGEVLGGTTGTGAGTTGSGTTISGEKTAATKDGTKVVNEKSEANSREQSNNNTAVIDSIEKETSNYEKTRSDSINEEEIEELFRRLDINGSGVIEYSHFIAATINHQNVKSEGLLRMAFDSMDVSRNGFITKGDLRELLYNESSNDTEDGQYIDRILDVADFKGDGKISFEEFKRLMIAEEVEDQKALAAVLETATPHQKSRSIDNVGGETVSIKEE